MDKIKQAHYEAMQKYGDYSEAGHALAMIARAIAEAEGRCKHCGKPLYSLIRVHHHQAYGVDATQ
jgi:hypothetical protein